MRTIYTKTTETLKQDGNTEFKFRGLHTFEHLYDVFPLFQMFYSINRCTCVYFILFVETIRSLFKTLQYEMNNAAVRQNDSNMTAGLCRHT